MTTIDLACHDASCAPPPVGTGGSKGGPSRGILSPTSEGRVRQPQGTWPQVRGLSDVEIMDGFTVEHNGYLARALRVERGSTTMKIHGEVRDSDGNRVGHYIRMLSEENGKVVATHDWLDIDPPAQGHGIAQALNDHALSFYQRIGVDSIELHAGLTVGPYAWARQGYRIGQSNLKPEATEKMRKDWVDDRLRAAKQKTILVKSEHFEEAQTFQREVTALINANKRGEDIQPIHVASLGQDNPALHWHDPDFGDMWPGKAVLVDSGGGRSETDLRDWYGIYYLEGREVPATVASAQNFLLTR